MLWLFALGTAWGSTDGADAQAREVTGASPCDELISIVAAAAAAAAAEPCVRRRGACAANRAARAGGATWSAKTPLLLGDGGGAAGVGGCDGGDAAAFLRYSKQWRSRGSEGVNAALTHASVITASGVLQP